MRRISDPDFEYRPWSAERREAASIAAEVRLYGSEEKAAKARAKKLVSLIKQRAELRKKLASVESAIRWAEKAMIKRALR